ncbi:MAG: 23S rRNA (guanosine(2251)-2'-O)-methyltransferase RlmB [Natronospirillum sp.]|uniref:23S rRNA (guanosine(2251)-2'-O)-methyltransferase RlmB n=1 Tax=Natronospirillum sp. TaxID=2812955 RepID=UPI0025F182F5|nr:23S rRNA (guanosine(2251)-2'-O)-methyltransferase RlmB [Natronospirillum sp.]MCH8550714.1 23S rRNA (guanosine(2251)-2'-O)-methyltransferase RlmB [Natronospirillum sp.]
MSDDSEAIAGLHAVQAALSERPERLRQVMVNGERHDRRLESILDAARHAGVPFEKLGSKAFQQRVQKLGLGDLRHQGVLALVQAIVPLDEQDLWPLLESSTAPLLLVLDGVTDPHNLGACLRVADAAGVHAVVVPRKRSAGLTATVVKVASGAAESVPLIQVTNLARVLRGLQEAGVWIVGTAGEADASLYQADLTGPVALVMGAEGAGMRRLTREHCDQLVHLPMQGQVSSVNVSVATGICLFEAVRQRTAIKPA